MSILADKTIWVIGASTGIGYALADRLAHMGNFVIVTARNEQKLDVLRQRHPNRIEVLAADVTSEDDVSNMEARLRAKTDYLDYAIFCAGTCEYEDGLRLQLDMYRRVMEINFLGAVSCSRTALPLLERNKGTLVALSSLASVVPFPRAEAYGASKAALEYFLQALSLDVKEKGVKISIVRPGFVDTPLTQKNDFDMPYLISSEQAADEIVAGLEKGRKSFAFPWQLRLPLYFFSYFKSVWMSFVALKFKKKANYNLE